MIKKKMGLEPIMEDKKIFSMRRIMEDLVNKQKKMMVFQRNYGWWKKKMGLGRIMEDLVKQKKEKKKKKRLRPLSESLHAIHN